MARRHTSGHHAWRQSYEAPRIGWNVLAQKATQKDDEFMEWVQHAVETVQKLSREVYADACVTVVGSVATKLNLAHSDLDLVVTRGCGAKKLSWEGEVVFLSDLSFQLYKHAGLPIADTTLIEAKVPILNISCEGGRNIDVTVNKLHALGHVLFFQNVMELYPTLHPIMKDIKRWIRARRLLVSKHGGVPIIATLFLAVYTCYETLNIRSFFELLASGKGVDIRFPANFPASPPVVHHGEYFAIYDPCQPEGRDQNLLSEVSSNILWIYQVEAKRFLKDVDMGISVEEIVRFEPEIKGRNTRRFALYLVDSQRLIGVRDCQSAFDGQFNTRRCMKDGFYEISVYVLMGKVLLPCGYNRNVHPSNYMCHIETDGFIVSENSLWLLRELDFCEDYKKYYGEMRRGEHDMAELHQRTDEQKEAAYALMNAVRARDDTKSAEKRSGGSFSSSELWVDRSETLGSSGVRETTPASRRDKNDWALPQKRRLLVAEMPAGCCLDTTELHDNAKHYSLSEGLCKSFSPGRKPPPSPIVLLPTPGRSRDRHQHYTYAAGM